MKPRLRTRTSYGIVCAAVWVAFVFGSFLLNGDPTIKEFGIGLAVAVIIDATIVRCLLVPAVMVLMGKRNWFIPKWLDRVAPHLSIEGAEFFDALDQIPPDQIPPSPSMPPARALA